MYLVEAPHHQCSPAGSNASALRCCGAQESRVCRRMAVAAADPTAWLVMLNQHQAALRQEQAKALAESDQPRELPDACTARGLPAPLSCLMPDAQSLAGAVTDRGTVLSRHFCRWVALLAVRAGAAGRTSPARQAICAHHMKHGCTLGPGLRLPAAQPEQVCSCMQRADLRLLRAAAVQARTPSQATGWTTCRAQPATREQPTAMPWQVGTSAAS